MVDNNIDYGPSSTRVMVVSTLQPSVALLHSMRSRCGEQLTVGLSDDVIAKFCTFDNNLVRAIEEASSLFNSLPSTLVEELQSDFINFYAQETINPYVALAARGPWVVTAHGAVLHDNGGYGMLGGGHGPDEIIDAMSKNWVMANVMTPSFSQKRLADGLRKELGHTRGSCPFSKFICMNSGSEAVTVACRISDVNSLRMTREGGRHAGKPTKLLANQIQLAQKKKLIVHR